MKKLIIAALALSFATAALAGTGVVGSKHDIPATYPSAMGVTAEAGAEGGRNRVCGYCHTPHHADLDSAGNGLPLWSRKTAIVTGKYMNYTAFTLDGGIAGSKTGDANIGSSWLCLSCHDGSVAVDQHYNFTGNTYLLGDAYGDTAIGEGTDLSNDHPIGVDMLAARLAEAGSGAQSGLVDATTAQFKGNTLLGTFPIANYLSEGTFVTCSSCHDVHNKDSVAEPYMLYASLDNSDICTSCHVK